MIVKLNLLKNGQLPKKQIDGDACYDAYANCERTTILPKERTLISLGFRVELPNDCELVIRPRSGLSKKGIDVAIGTVDSNYRGEVFVNVINNSNAPFEVNNGDRICQLAFRRFETTEFRLVDELSSSERGEKGFGSTGV